MLALQIEDIKSFMNKLLRSTIFDDFEVISLDLTILSRYSIDGKINTSFLSTDEKEIIGNRQYIKWSEVKDTVFHILKGSKAPTNIKIVFTLSQNAKNSIVEKSNTNLNTNDINGFYINIVFENNNLKIITGTNYKLFTLDKSIEQYFDKSIKKFFLNHQIVTSTID